MAYNGEIVSNEEVTCRARGERNRSIVLKYRSGELRGTVGRRNGEVAVS